jgi:muramoyltetrapeptide carboxypeptidase LdcA involved in peptidoglycan recycling
MLADVPHRAARAAAALGALGYRVTFSRHASERWGHLAGSPRQRADDLEAAFADDDVDAILCSFAASLTADVLPELDLDCVRQHPKVLIGRSDNGMLLLGLLARARLVSFYGVSLLNQFGEYPVPHAQTVESFLDACARPEPTQMRPVGRRTEAFRPFRNRLADEQCRALEMPAGWHWLKQGSATGPLIGGELTSLLLLLETGWLPDLAGAILFWDVVSVSTVTVEWALRELADRGVLAECAGMVVGLPTRILATQHARSVDELLADELPPLVPGPILVDADCSHADPVWTLPLGVEATLDSATDAFVVAGAVVP